MQRKVKLNKIAEGMLDTLISPNVTRTEGKGCDNMSVIIIDFRKWTFINITLYIKTHLYQILEIHSSQLSLIYWQQIGTKYNHLIIKLINIDLEWKNILNLNHYNCIG